MYINKHVETILFFVILEVINYINISVQAENENFSAPTFLEAFDLNFHMAGHFLL